jgi:hypothetical protein
MLVQAEYAETDHKDSGLHTFTQGINDEPSASTML